MNTLFIDTTANSLVVSAVNPTPCLPPVLTVGDTVSLQVAFLQRNPQPLNTGYPIYTAQDFSGSGVVLSVGLQGGQPSSGVFTLSFAASTTGPLPYNLSQYDLSVALNGLASVISAGGVTASGPIGGPFVVRFITNAAQALFTAGPNALFPMSTIVITSLQSGSTYNPSSQVITMICNPVAQISSWTPQPAPAVTVTSISGTVIQQVTIPPGTYGGSFTLTYNGNTTAALPYACQLDLMQSALNSLPGIAGATVIPGQNTWQITIPGGTHALTGSASGLICPLYLTGVLNLTSPSLASLLNGGSSVLLPLSIVTTIPAVATQFSGPVTINSSPAYGPNPAMPASLTALPRPDINGLSSASNSLDKQSTANGVIPVGECFILSLVVGGFVAGQTFQLTANPPSANGTTVIWPLDYNSSTNAVGWIRIF